MEAKWKMEKSIALIIGPRERGYVRLRGDGKGAIAEGTTRRASLVIADLRNTFSLSLLVCLSPRPLALSDRVLIKLAITAITSLSVRENEIDFGKVLSCLTSD